MCIARHNLDTEGEQLRALLEKELGVTMNYETGMNRLQLYDDKFENEIIILFDGRHRVAIENVKFSKQRQGVFTKVFQWFLAYCVQHRIVHFVVLGVNTVAMERWCVRNALYPIEGASEVTSDGHVHGNFYCNAEGHPDAYMFARSASWRWVG